MAAEEPIRISLSELYAMLPDHLAETEPFDVQAGLARLNRWIDEQENEQMTTSELAAALEDELDVHVLTAAQIYLEVAGAVPRTELIRVLAPHLEVSPWATAASIDRLIADCSLQMAENTVSLPTGGDDRETKEN